MHSLNVRKGCIILELDLVQPAAAVGAEAEAEAAGAPCAPEWLQLLQLHDFVDLRTPNNIISIKVGDHVSI